MTDEQRQSLLRQLQRIRRLLCDASEILRDCYTDLGLPMDEAGLLWPGQQPNTEYGLPDIGRKAA